MILEPANKIRHSKSTILNPTAHNNLTDYTVLDCEDLKGHHIQNLIDKHLEMEVKQLIPTEAGQYIQHSIS